MTKRKPPDYGDPVSRERKAHERLGTDTPRCVVCGEARAVILTPHRVPGSEYDPETMIYCRNHHRLQIVGQKDPHESTELAGAACRQLKTDTPACLVCGENRPVILEADHIAARKYDPATMILCLNHHGVKTDAQKDFPMNVNDSPNMLETIGHWLLNLAQLFEMLFEKLREFGHYLIELAAKQAEGDGQ